MFLNSSAQKKKKVKKFRTFKNRGEAFKKNRPKLDKSLAWIEQLHESNKSQIAHRVYQLFAHSVETRLALFGCLRSGRVDFPPAFW